MKTHNLKLDINFCDEVLSGEKSFEIRFNDRGYQKGDFIRFTAVNSRGTGTCRPIDRVLYKINYVLSGHNLKDGYVALAIAKAEDAQNDI